MRRTLGSILLLSALACACTTATQDTQQSGSDVTASGAGGPDAPSHDDAGPDGAPVPGPTPPPVDGGPSCGAGAASLCPPGERCQLAADCDSKVCGADADQRCAVPTATDGVQNGDETDVDCGGTSTSAPACALDKKCRVHADCASDACTYKGVCVAEKSCTAHHGGDTCGPGSAESCCTSIDMPGAPGGDVKLDKYVVTAGRFRQFVERTNGDMRGWIQGHTPSWWDASWSSLLPTQLDSGGTDPDFAGVYQELGPYVHGTATGGNEGCYVNGYGTRTFRLPDAVNAKLGDAQSYPQDVLDEKMMNCVTVYMMAAFCAWDGGKLPTRAQFDYAWGGATYPWGASPAPAGYATAFDSDATGSPVTPPGGDVKRANFDYNFWSPATRVGTDYSIYIATPGSFPDGNGPFGHADLAGGVFQFEEIVGTSANWSKSGSWQGHPIPYPTASFPGSNKYWATGGRCAR
jgi:formylglycine-generating enzyme required for sulfatase activity